MTKLIVMTTLVLVCSASLVQAEMKNGVEDGMPPSSGSSTMDMNNMNTMNNDTMKEMDMRGMDTNGDAMISKREWKSHHDMMWKMMKSRNGKVPMTDIEAMMKKC